MILEKDTKIKWLREAVEYALGCGHLTMGQEAELRRRAALQSAGEGEVMK